MKRRKEGKEKWEDFEARMGMNRSCAVSVTELLKAGKLVKPPATNITVLDLENFDVAEMNWVKSGSLTLDIEERRFAHGAFRDAFRATTIGEDAAQTAWVMKQYEEEAAKTINDNLGMSLEDHTRKQVQMTAVVRHLPKDLLKAYHLNLVVHLSM
ncbi:hypothetical protein AWC38_SpisGene8283 [Stylophora pistillata]|uniref:Uncharacterized protein n=1 Tax=Stylophora pistillata TaxID=50429 RepID=A0A2B4SES7_STYPI|nr:hypothetical protein AWC38_SpisGene8283 [Stylophora pistillata]